jgi:enoyl-CoA hydratase/carnithine racemase
VLISGIRVTRDEEIQLIELDGPEGFPRLTRALIAELREQLSKTQSDAAFSAIVLTGTEKCFCAGADVTEVSALTPLEALHFSALGQSLMNEIERSPKPVVAAIRGYCLGGGFDLALACHLRVAATDAVFRHPGVSLGIITGWGGTQRLPRLASPAGRARIREALFASDKLTAQEALDCGLVQRFADPSATVAASATLARSLRRNDNAGALV